jgi:CubicO group peptidase (beta-lactamase class C family)
MIAPFPQYRGAQTLWLLIQSYSSLWRGRAGSKEGRIAAVIGTIVIAGGLAGAATPVWRDGQVIQTTCVGWRDVEARRPIVRHTLFRVASMAKPITSAAALMLFEEGRFALDDPIALWATDFSEMRVLRSPPSSLDETDPAERSITFEDLLTHRSGLTCGSFTVVRSRRPTTRRWVAISTAKWRSMTGSRGSPLCR